VILLSIATASLSARLSELRRSRRQLAQFGRVDTAHNQGKLGTLMLQRGSVRAAIPALERAVAGDPGRRTGQAGSCQLRGREARSHRL
jgi:hypothetical protein